MGSRAGAVLLTCWKITELRNPVTSARLLCRPARLGGSGDSSPHTADGALAALRATARRLYGSPSLDGRRCALIGLGRVGERLGRLLAAEGADLTATDIDPGRQGVCDALGAAWCDPEKIVAADVDILIPAALGGLLTPEVVPELRCEAIAGPANDQLASPEVADLLHARSILWVPDQVVSAGGVINAVTTELHRLDAAEARARVAAIETTVDDLLATAGEHGRPPARVAADLARHRIGAPSGRVPAA
ncbi:Rossmann-fold NAD(P)-binding domain-containing protein [Actinomadura sediminis]|uniref:Glutamate/phenylalanine/leucine/valine/L-tryptophan dehydrogenase C-terminal domain-containing protein n=1 Tax=Actinomadura sediminis TaxID=1038904 RepID=A0ABW3EM34_9ACTN